MRQKSVIITGAGKGIGRATLSACLAGGFDVLACDINAELLAALREQFGTAISTHCFDVADHDAVTKFYAALDTKPNYLVNNAGIYPARNILDYAPDEMKAVFNTNVLGPAYMTQAFARPLMENKSEGVIVNVASVAQYGSADAIYGASKGAVAALTRCCAFSFSPYIRVNAVAPGIVQTDMFATVPEHVLEWYRRTELIKTPIQAEDVAKTILFLLSEDSKHYSGATLDLNNGFHRH